MRDAGKRERALHISRGEGAEIAEEEGQDGGDAKERRELHGNRGERSGGEEYEGERAGGLGGRAEEGGGGRRGALVDVRNPGVERESAELEGDAAEDEGDAGEREGRDRVRDGLGSEGLADLAEVERVGDTDGAQRAVDEHDAHQEQGGAETARDEVFHAGFERGFAAAQVADEYVEADGGRFEREEERDEVVRLHEEHERSRDDQEHMVVVGDGGIAVAQEAFGDETRQQGREQENHAHAVGGQVLTEQAGERCDVGRLDPGSVGQRHDGDEDKADASGDRDERAERLGKEHRLQEAEEREAGDGDLGQDG